MQSLIERLKERKLVQWSLAYLAGAWLVLQVTDILGEQFAWSAALLRSITVLLGIGFLAALVLAWYHGEKGQQRVSGPELLMLAGILVIAGAAVTMTHGGADSSATISERTDAEEVGAPAAASAAEPATTSIAVLPFVNMSAEKENEYLSDGIAEELLNALAKIEGLQIAARTSSFAFKGKDTSIRTIGQELGVATVLEGSVRKSGNRLKITAQLVNVKNGYHLWSETYERQMEDIFTIQEEIARAIVSTLRGKLGRQDDARLAERSTEDLTAYELYLKGRYFWNQRTEEGLRKAIEHFEQVVEREPTFARAYVGLADAYAVLGFYDYLPPGEAFPRAKAAAEKALGIDRTLAEPYATLGYVALYYDWDWPEAERQFRRVIQLNPSYPVAHQWYANLLVAMGRFPEAEQEMRRSRELDPLSPIANAVLGWVHYHAGQPHQAVAQYRETLELFPNYMLAHLWSGQAYERLGRQEEAIQAFQQAVALSRRSIIAVAALAHAYAAAGQQNQARELLTGLLREGEKKYIPSYEIAKIYLALGQEGQALEWLERSYTQRSHSMVFLKVDPQLASLRFDPRFVRLVKEVGLE